MRNEGTSDGTKTGEVYTGSPSAVQTNLLTYGTPTPYIDYVLRGNEFVLWAGETTNCVYLPGNSIAVSRVLSIVIDDDTTDIKQIKAQESNDLWYNIQGVQAFTLKGKGIYIHNGKKILR